MGLVRLLKAAAMLGERRWTQKPMRSRRPPPPYWERRDVTGTHDGWLAWWSVEHRHPKSGLEMLGQVMSSALNDDTFMSNSAPCDEAAALDENESTRRGGNTSTEGNQRLPKT